MAPACAETGGLSAAAAHWHMMNRDCLPADMDEQEIKVLYELSTAWDRQRKAMVDEPIPGAAPANTCINLLVNCLHSAKGRMCVVLKNCGCRQRSPPLSAVPSGQILRSGLFQVGVERQCESASSQTNVHKS